MQEARDSLLIESFVIVKERGDLSLFTIQTGELQQKQRSSSARGIAARPGAGRHSRDSGSSWQRLVTALQQTPTKKNLGFVVVAKR
jgi:hypothetical protein